MIKRITWFVGGAITGVTGAVLAGRRIKRRVGALTPVRLAKQTQTRVRDTMTEVVDAVNEGREAMRVKEAEMKARLTPIDPGIVWSPRR